MQTIDEISIGRDGDMFTLTIYHYPLDDEHLPAGPNVGTTFLIGLPDQFHAETQRTIGAWLTPAVDPGIQARADAIAEGRPHWPDQKAPPWPYSSDALTHDAQGDDDQ